MMLLMCVPMLLVVGFLVVTGRAGSTSILAALLCVGVMSALARRKLIEKSRGTLILRDLEALKTMVDHEDELGWR